MALGVNYNNKQNGQFQPTVYSNYKMSNTLSAVDQTTFSATFWNKILKLSIAPRKQTSDDSVVWDFDNSISIYINHTKARILANELKLFLSDPATYNSSGVPSGMGLITISNGSEFGVNGTFLVIRKINENGTPESSYAYQFKDDYFYSVRNYNDKTSEFNRSFEDYRNIEVEQLITLLEMYYQSMTNALAYSVVDALQYQNSRMHSSLEEIASKLGVSLKGGNSRQPKQESFFNKPQQDYNKKTIDDISAQLE